MYIILVRPWKASNEAVSNDKTVHIMQPKLKAALLTESGLWIYICKGFCFHFLFTSFSLIFDALDSWTGGISMVTQVPFWGTESRAAISLKVFKLPVIS